MTSRVWISRWPARINRWTALGLPLDALLLTGVCCWYFMSSAGRGCSCPRIYAGARMPLLRQASRIAHHADSSRRCGAALYARRYAHPAACPAGRAASQRPAKGCRTRAYPHCGGGAQAVPLSQANASDVNAGAADRRCSGYSSCRWESGICSRRRSERPRLKSAMGLFNVALRALAWMINTSAVCRQRLGTMAVEIRH